MTDTPSPLRRLTRSSRRAASSRSSAAVGSSITRIRASIARAFAISTNCCWAIDRSPAPVSAADRRTEAGEQTLCIVAHLAPIKHAVARRLDAEKDVLRDAPVRQEAQLLMDNADAGAARCNGVRKFDLLAIEEYPAAIGLIGAAKDFDQRRLSRAVLAAERMDLAARAAERHIVQRPHAGEGLADVQHLEGERRALH